MKTLNDDYDNSFRPWLPIFLAKVDYGRVSRILAGSMERCRARVRKVIRTEIENIIGSIGAAR